MDYNEYQIAAAKTAIYPKRRALEYTVLGLVSEVGELSGKYLIAKGTRSEEDWNNVLAELGDVLWYASEFARTLYITLKEDFGVSAAAVETITSRSRGFTVVHITEHAGEIAGAVKKFFRDSESGLDSLEDFIGSHYEQKALGHLRALLNQVENLAKLLDVDMEALMLSNLAKLQSRQKRNVLGGSGDTR